jgi:Big-like domain-containing protein
MEGMRKRFGLRATFAGLTVMAAAAASLVFLVSGAFANDLHQTTPISWQNFTQECSGSETLESGQVLWHFVHTGTTGADLPSTLTATFTDGTTTYVLQADGYSNGGGSAIVMYDIVTPANYSLISPTSDTISNDGLLNLSHVCPGSNEAGSVSNATTEIHNGATDSGTPSVVTGALDLGSTVHDSATISTDPAVALPSGSTVTFYFYNDGSCDTSDDTNAGDYAYTSGPLAATGPSPVTVDPALAEGPLAAGNYSYKAFFVSGDHSVALDATSDCEPLTINQGTSNTSTAIHLGATDSGTPIVVTGITVGQTVHDSATVTGTPAAFTPTGSVTFEWFTNGLCTDGTGTTLNTVALDVNGVADPSTAETPTVPGMYAFQAVYGGDGNYTGSTSGCEPLQVFNAPLTIGYWATHMYKCATGEKNGHNGCNSNGPFTLSYLGHSICTSPNTCTVGQLGNYNTGTGYANALAVFNANNCSNASTSDSNAAACLAAQLLAAELNVANGANTCICNTIHAANVWLSGAGYLGPGVKFTFATGYTRAQAITLKTALDIYNNGGSCPV